MTKAKGVEAVKLFRALEKENQNLTEKYKKLFADYQDLQFKANNADIKIIDLEKKCNELEIKLKTAYCCCGSNSWNEDGKTETILIQNDYDDGK